MVALAPDAAHAPLASIDEVAYRTLRGAGLSVVGACLVLGYDGDLVEHAFRVTFKGAPKRSPEVQARAWRRRREKCVAQGLCSRCRREPIAPRSRSRCEGCLAKAAAHERARAAAGKR